MKKLLLFFFLLTFSLGYSQGAAPGDPGRNSWDVISLFSAAYTNVAGTNFNPNWGQTNNHPNNLTTPSYGGDEVRQYQNTGNYQGTETASDINVSAMTRFHIEIYSSTLTSIRVSLIKTSGGGVEVPTTLALTPGTWNVFNIDISGASYNAVRPIFRQIKYDQPAGAGNIQNLIVDNLFFWRPATTQPPTFGAFSVPAKVVGDVPFGITAPSSNSLGALTYTSSNTAVATISGSTITVVGAGTSTITANQAADGIYGAGSTSATLSVTPSAAPTPPARNAWDVISFYNDSSGYALSSAPTWGGTASSDVSVGGNNIRFLANVTSAQIAFAATNVSEMTHVHIDVFSLNQTPMWFWLMNQRVIVNTPINGWTSIDIPLSSYSSLGVNLSTVNLFRIENPTGAGLPLKQVYVDNIYFYRPASLPPPTLGALTLPSPVTVGDAPFVLTNPTTNSTGAITYNSSNPLVATIIGNTLTFVGGGTSTITATVASDGTFGARSTSAVLTVTFPLPGPSPIPPARDPLSVVSLYTGTPTTYANVVAPVQAGWSTGSTTSNFNFANGTNTCVQVNNLGFFGLVGASNFSVAGMSTMHVDIYVNTPMTTMILNLLAPGDRNFSIGPLATGWNSFDIPLTTYPGALNNIAGVKFEQSGGTARQIYIDNLYFYTGGAPTITNFPSLARVNGAAPFNLTAPTSTSPGTFSYTSSNESVATISGSTVTIVGAGTSTITANQAASGFFTAGSISATLTVAASSVPLSGPTAPPARNAWDNFSVFSDEPSYTVIPGTRNYNPGWGQAGAGAVILAGTDNVWRASNLNYQGIVFGSNANVSAMTHFHVDVWTFDETSLQFFQISDTTGERSVALAAPYGALTQGSWVSYDIPLTAWTSQGGFSATNLKEFKIVGTGGKTVYLDNMYFYRAATTLPPTLGAFTVAAQVVGAAPFALTAPTSNSAGAFTYISSNEAVATIIGDTVTIVGAGTSTITATQAANGIYGTGTTTATLTVTPPAAPTPPARNTFDVRSYYSDAYASNAFNWGGSASTPLVISGDNARFVNDYTEANLAFSSANVSQMTTLHIDVFSDNQNPTWIRVNGIQVVVDTPVNQWTSLDIPLSSFPGLNLSSVTSVVIFNPRGAQNPRTDIYLDNIYFYRPQTDTPPTIGALTVPSPKVFGDAPFVLDNPTSDSSGAWTYSASPAGIVTFVGNTVTIVSGGNVTITATQAAVPGLFGPASTTAPLVVTFPAPGTSPIPPARDPLTVMSVYTGTPAQVYADSPNFVLSRASWTGATTSNFNFANGDNTCIQVNNLGFIGLADITERRLNVTGMTNLHLDVYCNTPISNLFVFLLAPGDRNYSTGPLNAGWNSLSIPLSAYPGPLNDIYGFKIEQNVAPNNTQIYLDNIYFSDDRRTYYQDSDGDGFGNLLVTQFVVNQPVGYVTNSTDCDDTNPALNPNNPCAPPTSIVNLRLYIQGYYAGSSTMASVKFNQDGVSSPTDVADVTVELHEATAPFATLHTATGTLQTDGIITASFSSAPSGSFYIAVKASNMVQTWSAAPQSVGSTPLSYDFSSAVAQAYGDNMTEIEPGVFAFYSGDFNQDGNVDPVDFGQWEIDYNNFASGVFATDLNGDANVDPADFGPWEVNYNNFISILRP